MSAPAVPAPTPLLRPGLAWTAMLVSGLLYYVAFPPLDLWPAGLLVWLLFRLALEGRSPKQALRMGLTGGTFMVFLGFYWLIGMLEVFSGFPLAACVFFALVVCVYQAGRFGMMAWTFARATQRGWNAHWVFVAAFVASELAFPLLFPWYFGVCFHTVPAFTQVADLGGAIFVGVPVCGFSMALAELVIARLRRRAVSKPTLALGFGGLALALGYGAVRIAQTDARVAAAPAVEVGMVQGNLGLKQKRLGGLGPLALHKKLTAELRAAGAEMVVWSETSVSSAVDERHYAEEIQRRYSQDLGVPTILGTVIRKPGEEIDWLFNSAVSTNAEGKVTARYDKHFLLMFGEYLPFGDTFPILYKWSPNSGKFTPGTHLDPLIIEHQGVARKVGTLICYEDIKPGFTNDVVRESNPDLLVNISNDAWFGDTSEPWEHFALAKLRAVEHRRYLVRSTNSGVSGVVDPVGRTVTHTGVFEEKVSRATVRWLSGATVYEILGDKLGWLTTLALLFACFRSPPERLRRWLGA